MVGLWGSVLALLTDLGGGGEGWGAQQLMAAAAIGQL